MVPVLRSQSDPQRTRCIVIVEVALAETIKSPGKRSHSPSPRRPAALRKSRPSSTSSSATGWRLPIPASVEAVHSLIALRYVQHGLHTHLHYGTDDPLLLNGLIQVTDACHPLHHPDPEFARATAEFAVVRDLVQMPGGHGCVARSSLHPRTEAPDRFEAQLDRVFLAPDAPYAPAQTAQSS